MPLTFVEPKYEKERKLEEMRWKAALAYASAGLHIDDCIRMSERLVEEFERRRGVKPEVKP